MKDKSASELPNLLTRLKNEEYCYLTTIGRVTGKTHQIEIWFGLEKTRLYLLSGGMDRSDWVKNLLKNPSVTVRIAKHTFKATARIVTDEREEMMVRNLLADKYHERRANGLLGKWARTALVVGMDINSSKNR